MKQSNFPLILALTASLLGFLNFGCFKKDSSDDPDLPGVAGWVEEFGTGKRLPNAKVYAISCEGEILGPITCSTTDTTRTDANGHYEMANKPEWVNATASGYWADYHYLTPVLFQKELATIVTLHPYAWIEVTIRNESGAWGFYPERTQSWLPPLRLSMGEEIVFRDALDFRKGNTTTRYLFTPILDENGVTPPKEYWDNNVKTFVDGEEVLYNIGTSGFVDFYLPGHDTTKLLIIY